MSKKKSVPISKLARFAAAPGAYSKNSKNSMNKDAIKYGNRAHAAIGATPSKVLFVIVAVAIVAGALYLGLI